ncbi:MAG: hypothetical protein JSW27_20790 [Phycisphaerales bacterium]|nr:MAG: hypothetical protein JSW27_20790 [Phycisphaerales bacterium]
MNGRLLARYVGKDWWFLLGLQVAIPALVTVAAPLLTLLFRARQGDFTLVWIALAAALVGVVLLFFAKVPLYRQGRYFTFGSRALPKPQRRTYRLAYVFIGASLLLMLMLLVALT